MLRVKYCANVTDSSGYSEAARNYVASLRAAGAEVSLELLAFGRWKADGGFGRHLGPLLNVPAGRHDAKVVHATADRFPPLWEPMTRNVGCTVWETDRVPDAWVQGCNRMDQVWLPCRWNVETFRRCGVTAPLHVVPHAISPEAVDAQADGGAPAADPLPDLPPDAFVFYAIFQWYERKNPIGLLKAYLTEFAPNERVCLVLKTFLAEHAASEQAELEQRVGVLKRNLNMATRPTPPFRFVVREMTRPEVSALHRRGDCYVLPHRSEGWGVPLAEAMAAGNPVIATGYGGNLEFMTPDNSYLLDYQLTPVCGMPHVAGYRGDQMWAEPDLAQLKRLMRHVYEHRDEARRRGARAARDMAAFSPANVGRRMVELLEGGRPS